MASSEKSGMSQNGTDSARTESVSFGTPSVRWTLAPTPTPTPQPASTPESSDYSTSVPGAGAYENPAWSESVGQYPLDQDLRLILGTAFTASRKRADGVVRAKFDLDRVYLEAFDLAFTGQLSKDAATLIEHIIGDRPGLRENFASYRQFDEVLERKEPAEPVSPELKKVLEQAVLTQRSMGDGVIRARHFVVATILRMRENQTNILQIFDAEMLQEAFEEHLKRSGDETRWIRALQGHEPPKLHFSREADDDELRLDAHAHADSIVEVLTTADDKEFSLALFGSWGRGKTSLMRLVKKRLEPDGDFLKRAWMFFKSLSGRSPDRRDSTYKVVTFSAWKFPSRPEVWVHLYETLANAAIGERFQLRAIPIAFRSVVAKRGTWSFLLALFLSAFGMLPLGLMFATGKTAVISVYSVFGMAGILWLISIVKSVRRVADQMTTVYLKAPRHTEKLGLQATVGSDLKALLKGWIPRRLFTPFDIVLYWSAALMAAFITGSRAADIPALGPPVGIASAVVVLAGAALFHWLVFSGWDAPKRILLVIDDLDRCEAEHMLTIIESIKLQLEDDEVSERVQAVVVVEEEILNHAILKKYGSLLEERTGVANTYSAERLLAENKEKLFTLNFRLPKLQGEELTSLVDAFAVGLKNAGTPAAEAIDVVLNAGTSDAQIRAEDRSFDSVTDPKTSSDVALAAESRSETVAAPGVTHPLKPEDYRAIRNAVAVLGEERKREFGPRAVRTFIFRYQLVRLLLLKKSEAWSSQRIADGLVDCYLTEGESTNSSIDPVIRKFCEMVC